MPIGAHRFVIGLVLTCFTAWIAPAADIPNPLLFPVVDPEADGFLGLSLVNTAETANEVTVTWTNAAASVRTGSLTLPPGTQRAFLLRETLGLPRDPPDGWIRVDASRPGLLGYLTSGTNTVLDGAEAISRPATTIVLEHVWVNTGFHELDAAETVVMIVNPGSVTARARADLIRLDGSSAGVLQFLIPGLASLNIRVSEAFGEALPPNNAGGRTFRGYMKLVSDLGVAAWLRVETPLSRRLLRGRALEQIVPSRLILAGHFACGSDLLYGSTLNLINAGDSPVGLEVVALDDRGNAIGSIARLTLDAGQSIREDVLTLFKIVMPAVFPPPLIVGSIRIRASSGGSFLAIGNIDIHANGNNAAMLYPVSADSSRAWTLPFAVSGRGYWTGYAIVNPNELLTVQADVSVELLDSEGRPVSPPRRVSLSPSASFTGLVEKELPTGYIRIQSSLPVFVVGSIGASNARTLAFLPAQ